MRSVKKASRGRVLAPASPEIRSSDVPALPGFFPPGGSLMFKPAGRCCIMEPGHEVPVRVLDPHSGLVLLSTKGGHGSGAGCQVGPLPSDPSTT
jgi:hypothetical protein